MTKQFSICTVTACLLLFLWGCSENAVVEISDSPEISMAAQESVISEEAAKWILSSPEYQRMIDLRREGLDLINEGLKRGIKPETFAEAFKRILDFLTRTMT